MAATASHVSAFDVASTTDAASYVTPTGSPTGNRWLRITVFNTIASGTPQTPTLSDSGPGLTYTQENTTAGGGLRCTVFYAKTTASPGSFTITADFAGNTQTSCAISVEEINGLDGSDPTIQSAVASVTNQIGVQVGLAALAGDNPVFFSAIRNDNESCDTDSGYTEYYDVGVATPNTRFFVQGILTGADNTPATADTGSNENSNWRAIAEELRLAVVQDSVNCGLITETESLFAAGIGLGIGQIIETEIVQPLSKAEVVLTQIIETESVFQLALGFGVAQIVETETVFSVNPIQFRPRVAAGGLVYLFGDREGILNLDQIVETEIILQVGLGVTIALITESEVLFPAIPSASPGPPTGLAQIVETETVFALVHGVGLPQIIELEFPMGLLSSGGTSGGSIVDAIEVSTGYMGKVKRTRQ